MIKVDEKIYRLILKVPRTISNGRIEVSAVGESNVGEKIFVTQASSVDSSVEVEAAGEAIRFKNLRGGADAKITFELPEDNYALGVAVYEDRISQTVRLSRAR